MNEQDFKNRLKENDIFFYEQLWKIVPRIIFGETDDTVHTVAYEVIEKAAAKYEVAYEDFGDDDEKFRLWLKGMIRYVAKNHLKWIIDRPMTGRDFYTPDEKKDHRKRADPKTRSLPKHEQAWRDGDEAMPDWMHGTSGGDYDEARYSPEVIQGVLDDGDLTLTPRDRKVLELMLDANKDGVFSDMTSLQQLHDAYPDRFSSYGAMSEACRVAIEKITEHRKQKRGC